MPESNDKDEISVLTSWMKRKGFWYPMSPTSPYSAASVKHRYGFYGIEISILYMDGLFKNVSVTMLNDEGIRYLYVYDRSIFDALKIIGVLEQGMLGLFPEED